MPALNASIFFFSSLEISPICNKPSTKSCRPLSVGRRPAETCGDFNKFKPSRLDITFLIVAEAKDGDIFFDSVFEPTGLPVSK